MTERRWLNPNSISSATERSFEKSKWQSASIHVEQLLAWETDFHAKDVLQNIIFMHVMWKWHAGKFISL